MNKLAHSSGGENALALAAGIAVAVHAIVIGLVDFRLPERSAPRPASLDVVLVNYASEQAPEETDFLAQADQRGSDERPEVPGSAGMPDAIEELRERIESATDAGAGEAESPAEDRQAGERTESVTTTQPTPSERPDENISAARLLEQSRDLARRGELDAGNAHDYPGQVRQKFISANTREHKYASYMRAWVAKVERVGNLNYPEQARRQRLAGDLVLSVDLLPDGSVSQIRVLKASGYDVLDEAAVRIVRLSAPFSPLPEGIRRETDVLTITRTWQFSSSGRLHGR